MLDDGQRAPIPVRTDSARFVHWGKTVVGLLVSAWTH
jgi:hypothetical protein